MTTAEQLRLAVVLTHPVPDAVIVLECVNGQRVIASHRPGSDLTVCQLRKVVVAVRRPGSPDWCALVERVDVGGGLEDLGGGVYRRRALGGAEQRWLVTTLPPDAVVDVLAALGARRGRGIEARVLTDQELDAVAIALQPVGPESEAEPCSAGRLDLVALDVAAACLAEELQRATASARS